MTSNDLIFWLVAGCIAALAGGILGLALWRGRAATGTASDVQVYRDQLAEVDRDLARGVLPATEAERVRVEISRRLLDADRRGPRATMGRGSRWGGAALAVLSVVGGLALYQRIGAPGYPDMPLAVRMQRAEDMRVNRPGQVEMETAAGSQAIADADPRHLELMAQLRDKLKDRPDDLQGYQLLARNEAALGNFDAAWRAQSRVVELEGDAANGQDYTDLADLMILAAKGYVSPEAEQALREALNRDPRNGTARYYTGLMFAQNDRADLAFRFWEPLVEAGPPDAPWVQAASEGIEAAAALAGIDYTLPRSAPFAGPGPTSDDIAAAQDLSAEDRQAMIRGMVERLGERLANEGGSAEDWARLINALGVLGDTTRAAAVWGEAQQRFADHPDDLAAIRTAAQSAGVVE